MRSSWWNGIGNSAVSHNARFSDINARFSDIKRSHLEGMIWFVNQMRRDRNLSESVKRYTFHLRIYVKKEDI